MVESVPPAKLTGHRGSSCKPAAVVRAVRLRSEEAVIHTFRAERMRAGVIVRRRAGGFGERVTGATRRDAEEKFAAAASSSGSYGKRDAKCPSGPTPNQAMSR